MIALGSNAEVSSPVSPVVACKMIGVGGAGLALLARVAAERPALLELVAMHTDARALMSSPASRKLQLGREASKGLGSGGDPALGHAAARENADEIRAECEGAEVVIVCAGLGRGTGSGAAPVIAQEARKAGALVLGVVTLPFAGEGGKRRELAQAALGRLGRHCISVLCFENDRMGELADPDSPVAEAFDSAAATVSQAVQAVLRMLSLPSFIHVGLDELVQLFRGAEARCQFGHGSASGSERARLAVDEALRSVMLEGGKLLSDAGNVLVHITADASLRLEEMNSVLRLISRHVEDSSQILLGVATDPAAGDLLGVTVMASTPVGGAVATIDEEDEEFADADEGGEEATVAAGDAGADAAQTAKPAKRGTKTTGKKAAAGQTQEELPLDQAMRGRFKDLDPTMVEGQDLDIPSFIRLRLRLK